MQKSSLKSVLFVLLLFLAALCLFTVAGCCQPCLRPSLPIEPAPQLLEVTTNEIGGLDESNTKSMLGNLYIYQGALDRCNNTILLYNKTTNQ